MPLITMRTFVDGLEALTIAGVTRQFTSGPPTAAPANLPAMFIYLPAITGVNRITLGNQGGGGTLGTQIIILVEAVAQNLQGQNFDDAVDMADTLEAALIASGCAIGGVLGWDINIIEFDVAGIVYWTVRAILTGGRW